VKPLNYGALMILPPVWDGHVYED